MRGGQRSAAERPGLVRATRDPDRARHRGPRGDECPASADTTIGPVFPAPGSGTWTSTGTPTGGEIGKAGGITWSYTGVDTTQFDQMVWGLGYPTFPSTFSFGLDTANLAFNPTTSNLSSGVLNFTGSAEFPNLDGKHAQLSDPAHGDD